MLIVEFGDPQFVMNKAFVREALADNQQKLHDQAARNKPGSSQKPLANTSSAPKGFVQRVKYMCAQATAAGREAQYDNVKAQMASEFGPKVVRGRIHTRFTSVPLCTTTRGGTALYPPLTIFAVCCATLSPASFVTITLLLWSGVDKSIQADDLRSNDRRVCRPSSAATILEGITCATTVQSAQPGSDPRPW